MNAASGYLKVWVLVLLCGGLGYGVYIQLGAETRPGMLSLPTQGKISNLPGVGELSPLKTLPDIGDLNQSIDRPLFSQNRRPGPPGLVQQTTQEANNDKPFDLELTGVMIVGDRRVALLKKVQGSKILDGTLGQTVEGWKIQEIEPNQVVLSQLGKTRRLKLEDRPLIQQRATTINRTLNKQQVLPGVQPRQPVAGRPAPSREELDEDSSLQLLPPGVVSTGQ